MFQRRLILNLVNSKYEAEPTEGRKVGGGQIFHEICLQFGSWLTYFCMCRLRLEKFLKIKIWVTFPLSIANI